MPPRYLVDTNTASYIIKGNVPRVRERLLKAPMSQVLISAITEAELLFGATQKREAVRLKTAIDEFLLRVDSLPWDSNAARRYADLLAALEIEGIPMGNLDMLIAAHALATEAVLVTNDRSFRRLKHLKLEDWTKWALRPHAWARSTCFSPASTAGAAAPLAGHGASGPAGDFAPPLLRTNNRSCHSFLELDSVFLDL
jgi:tRNA(fMet)-specific endonuclease VapC